MPRARTAGNRKYDLEERLIDFTDRVINVVEALPNTRAGSHVAAQLVRCGTSPLANYSEAKSAESRRDFVHKLRVGLKELREIRVWLLLIQRRPLVKPPERLATILAECEELIAIFVTSIRTAEANAGK